MVDDFGFALPDAKKEQIKKKISDLERMDEDGSYEENIKALDNLHEELHDIGIVSLLMEIQKAAEFAADTEPGQGVKFFRALEDIMAAVVNKDAEKVGRILEEIMPQAMAVIKAHESTPEMIHKDITR